jgi:CheY-like chemotaxis protein
MMIAMSSRTVDAPWLAPRAEALPREYPRSRGLRSSLGDEAGDDAPSSGQSHRSPRGWRYFPKVLRGVRVLVVDDDEDNMEVFSVALTACGAAVVTANRADEALRVLAAQRVDVVVSDIAMPGGDGYWLIDQVRRLPDPRFSSIPVVAITAYGREHSRARVLAAGFADHLQKPIDPAVLCQAIASAVGR